MMFSFERKILVLTLLAFVIGCSDVEMKPGDRARNNRDIPQGPGLFTGSQGEFVIYRSESEVEDNEKVGNPEDQTETEDAPM